MMSATSSGRHARFTSLTVSIAGMPRMEARRDRASAITRSTCSRVTNGRAASCTSTISVSAGTSASARATDSWRVPPPRTTRTGRPNRSSAIRFSSTAMSSARVAMMKSVMAAQAAKRRSVKITSGTPSSSRNCLGVSAPMRVPSPAAGTIAAMRLMAVSTGPAQRGEESTPSGTPDKH